MNQLYKSFQIIVLLFLPGLVFSQTKTVTVADTSKNTLEKAIGLFLADSELKNAAFTFLAVDSKTGKVIAESNPDMSIVPASTMKLITTASALEILGAGYRFKTTLQYTGYIDTAGVLHGDLYIKGGGDPSLGSKYFTDEKNDPFFMDAWVDTLKKSGITKIEGRVIADASIYGWEMVPSTWAWGDIGNGYGAAPCGISIYDNTCVLKFKTGSNAGDSALIECVQPFIPELEFDNEVIAANTQSDNSYIFGAPYSYKRYIRGSLPKGQDEYSVKGSIPDPSFLAAFELESALHQSGISTKYAATTLLDLKLAGKADTSARKDLYIHNSPYLSSIVYWTNLVSVNLFAEHLVNQIGHVKYGNGTVGSGTAAITDFWTKKGIDTKGMYVTDGSGLSRFDAVSSRHLVDILLYMLNKSKNASTFEKSLSVAGKSGTLSHLCKGTKAQGNLTAKSGTMQRVKSYAGYVTTKSGKKLAFAMIVNNFNCTTKQMEKKLEKLMVAMAEFSQ